MKHLVFQCLLKRRFCFADDQMEHTIPTLYLQPQSEERSYSVSSPSALYFNSSFVNNTSNETATQPYSSSQSLQTPEMTDGRTSIPMPHMEHTPIHGNRQLQEIMSTFNAFMYQQPYSSQEQLPPQAQHHQQYQHQQQYQQQYHQEYQPQQQPQPPYFDVFSNQPPHLYTSHVFTTPQQQFNVLPLPAVQAQEEPSNFAPLQPLPGTPVIAPATPVVASTSDSCKPSSTQIQLPPAQEDDPRVSPTPSTSTTTTSHQTHQTPPISPPRHLLAFIDPNNVRKNNRFKAKDNDLKCLMAVFEKNPFPSVSLRKKLAERLGLEQKQVQFWFQNRRATLKSNGILVIKPKVGGGMPVSVERKAELVSLTGERGYFYVEKGSALLDEGSESPVVSKME